MFLKVSMLIRHVHQKNKLFVTISIFSNKRLRFQATACNSSHDLLMMSIDTNNIAILNISSVYYRFIGFRISKNKAINLFKNADVSRKSGSL